MTGVLEVLAFLRENNFGEQSLSLLRDKSVDPTFVNGIFAVLNEDGDIMVKKIAIYAMKWLVTNGWLNIDQTGQLRAMLQHLVCQQLLTIPPDLSKDLNLLTKIIVLETFFADAWPNLMEVINEFFGKPEGLKPALTLLNSIAAGVKRHEEASEFWGTFASGVLPNLSVAMSQAGSLEIAALVFSCLYRLIRYVPICEELNAFLGSYQLLSNLEAPFHSEFGVKYFKFCYCMAKTPLREWQPHVMDVALQMMQMPIQPTLKCSILAFIGKCLEYPDTWVWFASIFPAAMTNVLFPLFALTGEELESAAGDAIEFVTEVHKEYCNDHNESISDPLKGFHDYDDVRAGAGKILYDCMCYNSEIFEKVVLGSMVMWAQGMCQTAVAPPVMFSVMDMCSHIARGKYAPQFAFLFGKAVEMVQQEDFFVQATGLFMLEYMPPELVNPELVNMTLNKVAHPSPLVQYYAARAFASQLKIMEKMQGKAEIRTALATNALNQIFEVFIGLANHFADFSLTNCLYRVVSFFGVEVHRFASALIEQFLRIGVLEAQTAIDAALPCQAIQEIISICAKNQEQSGMIFAETFAKLGMCLQAVTSMENIYVQESFFGTMKCFLKKCPFVKDLWNVLSAYSPIYICYFAEMIEILCLRDETLFESIDLVTNLISIVTSNPGDIDFCTDALPIITGLCMRAPPAHQQFMSLIPGFLTIITGIIGQGVESPALIKAANAILIYNVQYAMEVLQDAFGNYLTFIVESQDFTLTSMALINVSNCIPPDSDMQPVIGEALLRMAQEGRYEDDGYEDEDDDDIEMDTCRWYQPDDVQSAIITHIARMRGEVEG